MSQYQPSGRKYPRRCVWKARQREALRDRCEVSDVLLVYDGEAGEKKNAGTIDHLLPERWLRRHFPKRDPHEPVNLVCLSRSEHAYKTGIDRRLWKGNDILGFIRELSERSWPMGRVEKVFQFYGLAFPSHYSEAEIIKRVAS